MPRYFSGKLVSTKRLDATTATTFADLISHYVNLTTLLPVTPAEYHSLPSKHAKDDVKRQLGYLVACTFPESPGWVVGQKNMLGNATSYSWTLIIPVMQSYL